MLYEKYKIGQKESICRIFSQEDVNKFAALTGDTNPIHLNEEFASNSIFGKPVVHGVLASALFSTLLGTIFTKYGGIYLSQNSNFVKPIYIGEKITAEIELIDIRMKDIGFFNTKCYNEKGEIVIRGEAKCKLPL